MTPGSCAIVRSSRRRSRATASSSSTKRTWSPPPVSTRLLKIVEEPPEHVIFVFATTEPEKVLPTIRSRTHHYPFRLLAPKTMRGLIEKILASENVEVDDAVFPLVIRAGGGSPRDTLSVLDQLLAGAEDNRVHYQRALALLGATDVALIDEAVDALSAGDAAASVRCGGVGDRRRTRPASFRRGPAGAFPRSHCAASGSGGRQPRRGGCTRRMCWTGCAIRPPEWDLPRLPGTPRWSMRVSGRCAVPPPPDCCWRWCAPGCCCRRRPTPNQLCCNVSSVSRPGWTSPSRPERPSPPDPVHPASGMFARPSLPTRCRHRPRPRRRNRNRSQNRSPNPCMRRRPRPPRRQVLSRQPSLQMNLNLNQIPNLFLRNSNRSPNRRRNLSRSPQRHLLHRPQLPRRARSPRCRDGA